MKRVIQSIVHRLGREHVSESSEGAERSDATELLMTLLPYLQYRGLGCE